MFQDSLHGFFAVFILTSWNCISNMIFEVNKTHFTKTLGIQQSYRLGQNYSMEYMYIFY